MSIAEKLTQIAENEPKVYDAGKKAEHDEFWDSFNTGSGSTQWDYRFAGTGWSKANFRPTKDIIVSARTFARHSWNREELYDLTEHLNSLGVKITKMTNGRECFMYCTTFNRLPEIDASSCTYFYDTFYGMTRLVTIDKFIINTDKATTWNALLFTNCTKLVDINMDGSTIGKSISFSPCPLSVESMKSIISCLKDYSTEAPFTYTLTLSDSCKTALEADTEKVDEHSNYTYWEWITVKGWNLA